MSITSYYIIKQILMVHKRKEYKKVKIIKNIILLIILVTITVLLYKIQYTTLYTITIFLLNIAVFKSIFEITIEESITACALLMALLFFSDIITSSICGTVFGVKEFRANSIIFLITNLIVCISCTIMINIKIKN